MPMLPFAARSFAAARRIRAPHLPLRNASTKSTLKSRITEPFTNPAPPVLARYPAIHYPVKVLIWGLGFALSWHIWCEYFFTLSQAEGISMLPTVNATGDWLLLSKRYRRGRDVVVGDMVSFKHPIDEDTFSIKRVIGMPGDFVLRDSPDTSGAMIQIPEGHCYVVGDNLKFSRDSRMFGPLPLGLVKAKVIGKLSTSEREWSAMWSNLEDDGLRPANFYESEDVD